MILNFFIDFQILSEMTRHSYVFTALYKKAKVQLLQKHI